MFYFGFASMLSRTFVTLASRLGGVGIWEA